MISTAMEEKKPDLISKQSILTQGALPIIVEVDEVSKLEGKDLQGTENAAESRADDDEIMNEDDGHNFSIDRKYARKNLEELFTLFDIDGSGNISIEELTAVLQSLGKDYSEEDIREMHEIADKNGDGKVDFEDFHALMKGTILRGIQEDNLKDAFEVFDSDKDGFITAKELKELFEKLGEPIGIEEAWDMLNSVNSKHEGLIDFIDFKAYYEKEIERAEDKGDN